MAHPKRNSVGLCVSAPSHEQPPELPDLRARRRAVFSRLAGWFLLALLVTGLVLVTPDWLVTSIYHEQKLDQSWSQPALVALKMQIVTSGAVEASEKIPMGTGLQQLNVLSVDLANPNVRVGVGSAHNRLLDSGETLSAMAQRSGAVAAINGDFFKINGTRDALGMLEVNGQIWQSPASFAVLGVTASGRLTIGHEAFTGSVTAGGVSYPLHAINRQDDVGTANLTLFTPVLGAPLPLHGATVALLQPVAGSNQTFTVVSVKAGMARLPVLATQDALVGSGAAGSWLITHLASGTTLTLDERTTPDNDLIQAIGGGAILIKDGARYQDQRAPASGNDSERNPLTAIGINRDGTKALLVVCDGNQADASRSKGLTHAEMADY
ncbi:MAG TPA: phosphodiester glycosidase family protein, partial [Ktedonobacteraceae bacterium]|nr:phosphodiester glycosidase family protein [Ktedonobacteraceae bacterium]